VLILQRILAAAATDNKIDCNTLTVSGVTSSGALAHVPLVDSAVLLITPFASVDERGTESDETTLYVACPVTVMS